MRWGRSAILSTVTKIIVADVVSTPHATSRTSPSGSKRKRRALHITEQCFFAFYGPPLQKPPTRFPDANHPPNLREAPDWELGHGGNLQSFVRHQRHQLAVFHHHFVPSPSRGRLRPTSNLCTLLLAQTGNVSACYALSVALQDGEGIRADAPLAKALCLHATNAGDDVGTIFTLGVSWKTETACRGTPFVPRTGNNRQATKDMMLVS